MLNELALPPVCQVFSISGALPVFEMVELNGLLAVFSVWVGNVSADEETETWGALGGGAKSWIDELGQSGPAQGPFDQV
jgi:hypothetical protein